MKARFEFVHEYQYKQYIRMYASIEFIKASILSDSISDSSPDDTAKLAIEYADSLINNISNDKNVRSNNNK